MQFFPTLKIWILLSWAVSLISPRKSLVSYLLKTPFAFLSKGWRRWDVWGGREKKKILYWFHINLKSIDDLLEWLSNKTNTGWSDWVKWRTLDKLIFDPIFQYISSHPSRFMTSNVIINFNIFRIIRVCYSRIIKTNQSSGFMNLLDVVTQNRRLICSNLPHSYTAGLGWSLKTIIFLLLVPILIMSFINIIYKIWLETIFCTKIIRVITEAYNRIHLNISLLNMYC